MATLHTISSSKTQASTKEKRKMAFRFIRKSVFFLLFFGCLFFLVRSFWKSFYAENPSLMLDEITVSETNNYAGERQASKFSVNTILSELGIEAGAINLMDIDLAKIRRRLEQEPTMTNITVRRIFPNRLSIQFEEREPVALLICGPNTCYVDQSGTVLPMAHKSKPMAYSVTVVPKITAITHSDKLIPGTATQDKSILAAMQLIELVNQHIDFFNLNQIQLALSGEKMIARVSALPGCREFDDTAEIVFPTQNIKQALERMLECIRRLDLSPIQRIDVTIENNIPVITKDTK